jgi:hypothetical protein
VRTTVIHLTILAMVSLVGHLSPAYGQFPSAMPINSAVPANGQTTLAPAPAPSLGVYPSNPCASLACPNPCPQPCPSPYIPPCPPSVSPVYPTIPLGMTPTGSVVAGADLVVLQPRLDNFTQLALVIPAVNANIAATFPSYDYKLSPRVWAGYVGPTGLGVRGRYWEFDQVLADNQTVTTTTANPAIPNALAGLTFTTSTGLDAYTADGEVFQTADLQAWKGVFGGGLRYGQFDVDNLTRLTTANNVAVNLKADSGFHGLGPTAFAELRRPLGNQTGLALVGNVRGSVLYGDYLQATALSAPFAVPGGPAVSAFNLFTRQDAFLWIGEIQLGAQWFYQMRSGTNFYIQALWEAQTWSVSAADGITGNGRDLAFTGGSLGIGLMR